MPRWKQRWLHWNEEGNIWCNKQRQMDFKVGLFTLLTHLPDLMEEDYICSRRTQKTLFTETENNPEIYQKLLKTS